MAKAIIHRRIWTGSVFENVTIEVNVDFEALADKMARKAYHNKSRVAKEVSGAVVVKVIKP